jgi:hypothetical protein
MYTTDSLITVLEELREKLNIIPANRASDKDRRRVTTAVIDELLSTKLINTDHAYFLEMQLYAALKIEPMLCDPIPEENRLEDLYGRKAWDIDPLRLASAGHEPSEISPVVYRIIQILKGEQDGGKDTKHNGQGDKRADHDGNTRRKRKGVGGFKNKRNAPHTRV